MGLIFISSPYSHSDKNVVEYRYEQILEICSKLMMENKFVFSPIAHGHEMVKKHDVPSDWEYWQNYCRLCISKCDMVYVIMLEGWESSSGVQGEIAIAKELNVPIEYIKN